MSPNHLTHGSDRLVDLIARVNECLDGAGELPHAIEAVLWIVTDYPGVVAAWVEVVGAPRLGLAAQRWGVRSAQPGISTAHHRCPAIDTVLDHGGSLLIDVETAACTDCPVVAHLPERSFEIVSALERDRRTLGAVGVWFREDSQSTEVATVVVEELAVSIADALARRATEADPEIGRASLDHRTRQLADLYRYAPVGIVEAALDGRLVHANDAAAEILGYATVVDLRLHMPNVRDHLYVDAEVRRELIDRVLTDGIASGFEFAANRADGSICWLRAHTRLHTYRHGVEPTILSFIQDVTESRYQREELERNARTHALLLREVHHRVRNNLSMMLALINLQTTGVTAPDDAAQALTMAAARIRALAAAQELAFATEHVQEVRLDELIDRVVSEWAEDTPAVGQASCATTGVLTAGAETGTTVALAVQHILHTITRVHAPHSITVTVRPSDDTEAVVEFVVEGPGGDGPLAVDEILDALLRQLRGSLDVSDQPVYRLSFDRSIASPLIHAASM